MPIRCNGVEIEIDGKLVTQGWIDCNNSNCSTSRANPDNK